MGIACAPVVTTWTVPAGGRIEEGQSWGRVTPETYTVTVDFDYAGKSESTTITVTR